MSRLTFLRRIGRPVAVGHPVLVAAYTDGAAAWGGPLGDATFTVLFNALLFAPLLLAPFLVRRGLGVRVPAVCLLLPAIALQAFYVVAGALTLRLRDGIEPWAMYAVSLTCLIVLFVAMAMLLWTDKPMTPEASAGEPPRLEPTAAAE
jgi:hypothetical protein